MCETRETTRVDFILVFVFFNQMCTNEDWILVEHETKINGQWDRCFFKEIVKTTQGIMAAV